MKTSTGVLTALACAFAALPLPAPASPMSQSVHIARTAGTCPPSIAVEVTSKQYEGGGIFDYLAQTMKPAYAAQLVSATPQHIVFEAQLRPAYASCEGTGSSGEYVFALHRGTLRFTVSPSKGPDNVYPGLNDVGISKGMPHVNLSIPD